MYNLTQRHVHGIVFVRDKQWDLNIMNVCLRYSACKLHNFCFLSNCHLWPVWLYKIFPHYLIKGIINGIKSWNIKCVYVISLLHVSDTYLVLRSIEQDTVIKFSEILPSLSICLTHYCCQSLQKLSFLKRFSRSPKISKCMIICPVWRQIVPFGLKDKKTNRQT